MDINRFIFKIMTREVGLFNDTINEFEPKEVLRYLLDEDLINEVLNEYQLPMHIDPRESVDSLLLFAEDLARKHPKVFTEVFNEILEKNTSEESVLRCISVANANDLSQLRILKEILNRHDELMSSMASWAIEKAGK